jgi:hypothetical protein
VNTGPLSGVSPFGTGNYLSTSSINAELVLPGTVPGVTFEYAYTGGLTNLIINGAQSIQNASLLSLSGTKLGGVNIAATSSPIQGGHKGVVTLTGPVSSLSVGGQEFHLDSIRIVPEPGPHVALILAASGFLRRRAWRGRGR